MSRPIQAAPESFVNGRARLTRIRDAKICYGWVRDLDRSMVKLGVQNDVPVEFETLYLVELYGIGVQASFEAKATRRRTLDLDCEDPDSGEVAHHELYEFELELITPLVARHGDHPARFRTSNLVALVYHEDESFAVPIEDIGPRGVAITSPKDLPQNARLELAITTSMGAIDLEGSVRYSRTSRKSNDLFRVGIHLTKMGRIDQGRWKDLLASSRTPSARKERLAPIGNLRVVEAAFIGAGARMTRHGDGCAITGWVLQMEESEIIIQIESLSDFSPDDKVSIEVFGFEHHLLFEAIMKERFDTHFSFHLLDKQTIKAAREDSRISIDGLEVALIGPHGERVVGEVLDVSSNGMMFRSPIALDRGSRIEVTLRTELGPVRTDVEIRYCRQDAVSDYRIGALVYDMRRIERGRWNRLLGEAA